MPFSFLGQAYDLKYMCMPSGVNESAQTRPAVMSTAYDGLGAFAAARDRSGDMLARHRWRLS
jgi:hypothetical protein